MVQLEEVEDDELNQPQPGREEADDDWDTDSEASDDSDVAAAPDSETLTDRLLALRDMLPPTTRRRIASTSSTLGSYAKRGLVLGGKTLWVVSTSVLLLGVPWALAFSEEQQMLEMEKEQRMKEMGTELLTPGATSQGGQQQGRPAL